MIWVLQWKSIRNDVLKSQQIFFHLIALKPCTMMIKIAIVKSKFIALSRWFCMLISNFRLFQKADHNWDENPIMKYGYTKILYSLLDLIVSFFKKVTKSQISKETGNFFSEKVSKLLILHYSFWCTFLILNCIHGGKSAQVLKNT